MFRRRLDVERGPQPQLLQLEHSCVSSASGVKGYKQARK